MAICMKGDEPVTTRQYVTASFDSESDVSSQHVRTWCKRGWLPHERRSKRILVNSNHFPRTNKVGEGPHSYEKIYPTEKLTDIDVFCKRYFDTYSVATLIRKACLEGLIPCEKLGNMIFVYEYPAIAKLLSMNIEQAHEIGHKITFVAPDSFVLKTFENFDSDIESCLYSWCKEGKIPHINISTNDRPKYFVVQGTNYCEKPWGWKNAEFSIRHQPKLVTLEDYFERPENVALNLSESTKRELVRNGQLHTVSFAGRHYVENEAPDLITLVNIKEKDEYDSVANELLEERYSLAHLFCLDRKETPWFREDRKNDSVTIGNSNAQVEHQLPESGLLYELLFENEIMIGSFDKDLETFIDVFGQPIDENVMAYRFPMNMNGRNLRMDYRDIHRQLPVFQSRFYVQNLSTIPKS